MKTRTMILCALFAALTAVGAFFKIPFALAAISLQFLFTAMAGVLLGAGGLLRAYTKSAGDALAAAGKLDDPLFADAWQFARADRIVLAAPFWELSFPAILKIYLERVSMRDITFGYEESGLVGRCRAEKLLLVTTRGGDYSLPETEWMEMGARQLKALCAMFGIPKFELLCAEGLDDERVDAHSRMDEALARADALGKTF